MRNLSALVFTLLLVQGGFAFADDIVYQQPIATFPVASIGPTANGSAFGPIQINTPFLFSSITMWMQASTTDDYIALVDCYLDSSYTTRCPTWRLANTEPYRGFVMRGTVGTTGGGSAVAFSEALASTSAQFPTGAFMEVRVFPYDSTTARTIYGTSTPNRCESNCNGGTPYLYVYGAETQPPQYATTSRIRTLIQPDNGATAPSAEVTFQFAWFNSGAEAYSVAQVEISDLTSGFQYVPQQSNAALSGNGTTTQIYTLEPNHLHLWKACLANPVSGQRVCSPSRSLNVVGPSAPQSPLFPDVDGDNATSTAQGSLFGFLNIWTLLQSKYPFSWFFDVANLLYAASQMSGETMQPVVIDWADSGASTSTTKWLPPTWEVFSTTTVTRFMPAGFLEILRALMIAVVWFGFFAYLYHRIPRLFGGSTHSV